MTPIAGKDPPDRRASTRPAPGIGAAVHLRVDAVLVDRDHRMVGPQFPNPLQTNLEDLPMIRTASKFLAVSFLTFAGAAAMAAPATTPAPAPASTTIPSHVVHHRKLALVSKADTGASVTPAVAPATAGDAKAVPGAQGVKAERKGKKTAKASSHLKDKTATGATTSPKASAKGMEKSSSDTVEKKQ
jgi:hypothetical protein